MVRRRAIQRPLTPMKERQMKGLCQMAHTCLYLHSFPTILWPLNLQREREREREGERGREGGRERGREGRPSCLCVWPASRQQPVRRLFPLLLQRLASSEQELHFDRETVIWKAWDGTVVIGLPTICVVDLFCSG